MGDEMTLTELLPFSHTSRVLTEWLLDTQREYVHHSNLPFQLQTAIIRLPKASANIRLFKRR